MKVKENMPVVFVLKSAQNLSVQTPITKLELLENEESYYLSYDKTQLNSNGEILSTIYSVK